MGNGLSRQGDRVDAVVQARMSSTRLPGKVLARLGDHTVLELLVKRLANARELGEIVVATSTDQSDDRLASEANRLGVRVLRGPLSDVLARYVQACDSLRPDAVVRITADCPLIDPSVVDQVVRRWRTAGSDYASNTLEPRSYPDGLDVEVMSAASLRRLDRLAVDAVDREHVTIYIHRHPEQFSIAGLRLDPPLGSVRVTLDTAEDLRSLTLLVSDVGPDASMGSMLDALGFARPREVLEQP